MLGETGMQQGHKEPGLKKAATSRKPDIWQDLQEVSCAGSREAKSRTFTEK
jgi:hypothetical protein